MGGYFDAEFAEATRQLFARIAGNEFDVYLSEINEAELQNAPPQVKSVKELIPAGSYHYVEMTDEVKALALLYISEKALGQASRNNVQCY
jgi:hypothetical protein